MGICSLKYVYVREFTCVRKFDVCFSVHRSISVEKTTN